MQTLGTFNKCTKSHSLYIYIYILYIYIDSEIIYMERYSCDLSCPQPLFFWQFDKIPAVISEETLDDLSALGLRHVGWKQWAAGGF